MQLPIRVPSIPYLCPTALACALALCSIGSAQTAQPNSPDMLAALNRPVLESSSSSSTADLPDAPQDNTSSSTGHQDGQTKRILGIIPNFRAVNADVKLPPQSVKEKFMTATQDSFDYSTIFLPGVLAAYNQATNNTPEFHQGAAAYGRYFWHAYVDQTSENYFVEFIGPTITRQDSRYYTLGKGGFVKRTVYSLSRVVITRNDNGKEVFNSSEVFGAGAAAGISNLYYPSAERSFGQTGKQWGQSVGIDAGTFMFKEFWPDINHKLFHSSN